jgi:hypothetical protein
MIQTQLDEMIGTPPPSTVDVAALVRREKRGQAVRRAGYGMSAVVAAAVTAGVLVSGGAPGSGTHAGPPAGQPAVDTRFQLQASSKESAQASGKRLSQALDRALKKAVPGVEYVSFKRNLSNPVDGLPFIDGFTGGRGPGYWFAGDVNVAVDKHQGVLNLMAFSLPRPGDPVKRDRAGNVSPSVRVACDGEAGCTEGTGARGEKVIMVVTRKGDYQNREVRVAIPGDRLLSVSVSNLDGNDEGNAGSPPLTIAQLRAITAEVAGQIKA